MAERIIQIPYKPRPLQKSIHDALDLLRWGVLVCHRRFGKTVMAINHLIRSVLRDGRPRGRYAYLGPTYRQVKDVGWDYLKYFTSTIPGMAYNETELRADFPNEGRVRLYGAENPDALRGLYLDGVIFDEYGLMPSTIFDMVIRPALSDRKGYAVFIGTPAGRNQFYEVFEYAKTNPETWYSVLYKASETGIVPQDELDSAKAMMSSSYYEQEYECAFDVPLEGSYYATQIRQAQNERRIGRVPWDALLTVDTWWDLGVGDATAIWFSQATHEEVRLIDYYETSGEGLPFYVKLLRDKPYAYGTHHLPFDAQVRELGTGRSRVEMAESLGIKPINVVRKLPVDDGIDAIRSLFPRFWFDEIKCAQGINALRSYRKEWDDKRNEWKDAPYHDWSSHGADALRCLGVGINLPEKPKYKEWQTGKKQGSSSWKTI